MNLTALDQLWRSPAFPMWLTLAAAGFFAIVLLVTLLRADKSVANGALTVITLLAIGVAVAATIRGFGGGGLVSSASLGSPAPTASLPALSCIDDMAGETALTACEKVLFGSPESVAAAVAYASAQISRLTAFGDVTAANSNMTPELQSLRRSVERDRYGLMAYVLSVRDRCQPGDCAAYQSLTDHNQISANMDERIYESAIIRYAPSWSAPAVTAAPAPAVAALAPSLPSGKPTNADFPSATSIPPVNIMTPEPAASPSPPPRSATAAPAPAAPRQVSAPVAAKKPPATKRATASPPVQLAPAPVPAAANE